jgi:hypothetical protein
MGAMGLGERSGIRALAPSDHVEEGAQVGAAGSGDNDSRHEALQKRKAIQPQHAHQYLRWENRHQYAPIEKRLYSLPSGTTPGSVATQHWPYAGIKGNKETGHDTYIGDSVYQAVHDKADIGLQTSPT